MGWDYSYVITYKDKGKIRTYETEGNGLDAVLGVFFQDNGDICYNDIDNIEEIEN